MAVNQNNQSILNKSRLDKFLLVFSIPPALREINVRENSARNSTTVPSIQIPYAGSNLYQSAHAREPYPPVTVNFTADNEFNNYWVIYKWLNLMHDQKTGVYDESDLDPDNQFNNYQTDMTLYGLDEYENRRIEFTHSYTLNY